MKAAGNICIVNRAITIIYGMSNSTFSVWNIKHFTFIHSLRERAAPVTPIFSGGPPESKHPSKWLNGSGRIPLEQQCYTCFSKPISPPLYRHFPLPDCWLLKSSDPPWRFLYGKLSILWNSTCYTAKIHLISLPVASVGAEPWLLW